ncbi:MAG: hypothetical protein N3F66_11790 [Spirochaetes bacterium]|nr:hypothetical protein [Spirochaetota bacterium]
MKKSFYYSIIILFIISLVSSCSTVSNNQQKSQVYSFSADTLTLPKSKDLIDKTPTYEVYFELIQNTQCLDITVIAQDKNGKRVRCGFILESFVDVSHFPKKPPKPVYTELAKNFDINWRFQSNINVCNDTNDPLKRLNKGSYRLKITAFSNNFYNFTIDITSAVPVEFQK